MWGLPVFIPVRGSRTGGDRELKTPTASTRTCARNCFWEWVHVYVSAYIYLHSAISREVEHLSTTTVSSSRVRRVI
ncbi:hypothetical protein PISMIDRAFT_683040 [Pisolithus microcarpus 441]|uniref:Uncharacterized protein n=1 Tax=Pisolithus microcarpus 441 TaxID=765257 RepID=A0A0C9Y4G9_9AGAM|nr:hypothetical protein BKA83DRAFT_683040 [Pisolithus microcarpus]KIK19565.1 hypothetical protein PISMIDRAFT_683040 [Pisolithus microcarpus 441]